MMLIPCINCGLRNADEFVYSGEELQQPDPAATDPEEWRRFLYMRSNPAGWTVERWFHHAGCRQYFTVERHTVRNEIRAARPPTAQLRLNERAAGPQSDSEEGIGP